MTAIDYTAVKTVREWPYTIDGPIDVVPKPAEWMHNWLYSVVPVGVRREEYRDRAFQNSTSGYAPTSIGNNEVEYPLAAYLTGFCKNCRKVFSTPIPHNDSGYVETQTSVPVYGCVSPQ